MIITKMHIPRRTILRGIGASVALPLLDSMFPAFVSAASAPSRFGALFVPMGAAPGYWTPKTVGKLELSPILQPMSAVADRCLVVTGVSSNQADIKDGGPHPRTQAAWLTGSLPKRTEGSDIRAGISLDQVAALAIGTETQLPSLQVGIESNSVLGVCAQGYSCAYSNTISWRNETTPMPMEDNPRAVFERLFGGSDSTDARTRMSDIRKDRSVLDSVMGELNRFQKGIGAGDRAKVSQYVDAVRDVEHRIQKAEEQATKELPVVDRPVGIPATFEEHAKIMIDLLTLAFQCDLTRVFTFLMAREASARAYPEIGVAESHHPLSHHQENPDKLAKLAKLNAYHVKMFAQLVEKLKATPDGDGTLLDNTVMLYGSGMGDPNVHSPLNVVSLVVAGSKTGIKTGRHLKVPDNTPLANLQLALIEKAGVRIERFANSTQPLDLVSL